ncbi:hypothetical protein AGMMS49574_25410 [Bacteroidia bacterium]|nr:hypothetical protein AGMMS49574_25410 [Bacteroidia bacterium]
MTYTGKGFVTGNGSIPGSCRFAGILIVKGQTGATYYIEKAVVMDIV